jgi:hypothetical protein
MWGKAGQISSQCGNSGKFSGNFLANFLAILANYRKKHIEKG